MPNGKELQTPPYVSFTSLDGFVKRLKDTVIPPVIDGSILAKMSGSAASQMRVALRFLGLTRVDGDKDHVTPKLHDLVAAHGDEGKWQGQWRQIVADVYDPITKDIDLENATDQQLSDAFRTGTDATSTIDRVVRFYVAALDAAGIEYSPFFKSRRRSSGPGGTAKKKRSRKKRTASPGKDVAEEETPSPPDDWQRFELPLKGAGQKVRIDLPEDLTQRQWEYIRTTVEGYFGMAWVSEEDTK